MTRQPPVGQAARVRVWVLFALLLLSGTDAAYMVATNHAPGCALYRPISGKLLIAHAGGGLPDRMYANSIEALDRSYSRGFRVFEMDFHQLPFGVMRAGHDPVDVLDPREAWLSQVLDWIRRHPGTRLMPDMKTNNVRGLRLIASEAPDLRQRITPFVYTKSQYPAVRAIGLSLPVYAIFSGDDPDWLGFANSHAFAAVALPKRHLDLIARVRHPVIVFKYDSLVHAPGAQAAMSDCMVPAAFKPAAFRTATRRAGA